MERKGEKQQKEGLSSEALPKVQALDADAILSPFNQQSYFIIMRLTPSLFPVRWRSGPATQLEVPRGKCQGVCPIFKTDQEFEEFFFRAWQQSNSTGEAEPCKVL